MLEQKIAVAITNAATHLSTFRFITHYGQLLKLSDNVLDCLIELESLFVEEAERQNANIDGVVSGHHNDNLELLKAAKIRSPLSDLGDCWVYLDPHSGDMQLTLIRRVIEAQ